VFSPYAVSAGETRCGLCRRLEPPLVKAVAYGSYDGGLRELIHLLKPIVFVATVGRTLKADAQGIGMAHSFAEDERTVAATG
jgi:hypothetical protein